MAACRSHSRVGPMRAARVIVASVWACAAALTAACPGAPKSPVDHTVPRTAAKKAGARTLTIIGTNDLHGAIDRLPLLAGFVDNVRAARAADGGGVLLLDAGDMFQ